jgi:phage host-nuclease inhibitor protein Gam
MKARTKTRGANIRVPQSRDEAAVSVARIGELDREIGRIKADLNDEVARLKTSAESAAQVMADEVIELTEGLRIWAEANRQVLTDGGKVKFHDLGVGKILWRLRRPSVKVRGADTIVETLRALGFGRFIRISEDIDREAMLREPEVARTVPGITVGSEGEDFVVEPFDVALAARGAA